MSSNNNFFGKVSAVAFGAVLAFAVTSGAYAGEGSGNPKNDAGYTTAPAAAHYIWKDGKLIPNPKRNEPRNDGYKPSGK